LNLPESPLDLLLLRGSSCCYGRCLMQWPPSRPTIPHHVCRWWI